MDGVDLFLIPMFAQRSNTDILVHDGFSGWLDDFDLHIEFREISDPSDGCAIQLGEFEFELWATGELVVEFQGVEQLRATTLRVLEARANRVSEPGGRNQVRWRTYPETGQHVLRLRDECSSRVQGHGGGEVGMIKVDWREGVV